MLLGSNLSQAEFNAAVQKQKDPMAETWEWIKVMVTKTVESSLGYCFIVVKRILYSKYVKI